MTTVDAAPSAGRNPAVMLYTLKLHKSRRLQAVDAVRRWQRERLMELPAEFAQLVPGVMGEKAKHFKS